MSILLISTKSVLRKTIFSDPYKNKIRIREIAVVVELVETVEK